MTLIVFNVLKVNAVFCKMLDIKEFCSRAKICLDIKFGFEYVYCYWWMWFYRLKYRKTS